jgi:manganese/zinc/iron transport system substrate-binding protein
MGRRRKFINAVMVVLAGSLVAGTAMAQEKIKAATTIGMVADLVKQVGSDRVEVDQLMGPGIDPISINPHPRMPVV